MVIPGGVAGCVLQLGTAGPETDTRQRFPPARAARHAAGMTLRSPGPVVATVLAGACAASCASQPDTGPGVAAPPAPPPESAPSQPEAGSPEQVCAALAGSAYTADPAREPTPALARQRAAEKYGTPELAQQWRGSGHDPLWQRLAATGGQLRAETSPVQDAAPPARTGQAAAAVHVRPIAVWPERSEPQPGMLLYCGLSQSPQGWRVDSVQLASE